MVRCGGPGGGLWPARAQRGVCRAARFTCRRSPPPADTTAVPVPTHGRSRLHREQEGRVCSCPPLRSPSSLWVCSLPPNSALVVECYTFIHSVKPTEHLPRDGASWHLPGQWLWVRVHRRAGSQGWAPQLTGDRKPLVPTLWTVPGETLTPAFSPASHPSAGRCPGRWTTRRTPGEWVSGVPLCWRHVVPGYPLCLQGG